MSSSSAASALSWWTDAGVDTLVDEQPRDWLRPARRASAAMPGPAPAPTMPDTIEAFRFWFIDPAMLPLGALTAARIAPAGDPASDLMVMIDMPGQADLAAGTLLSGTAGALFDRMMAAIGQSRETLYLSSLSPLRTPTGALDAAEAETLSAIARHHIGLVRPRALLLFGDACAKILLGGAVTTARGRWHDLDTPAGPIRAMATIRPEKLELVPGLKKIAWEDLQMLKEGLAS
jgi:uracil-DNA glycosylase family 4